MSTGVIIVMLVMAVPIAGIISSTILKYRKMELDRHHPEPLAGFSDEEKQTLVDTLKRFKEEHKRLEAQNQALTERVEQLEKKLLSPPDSQS